MTLPTKRILLKGGIIQINKFLYESGSTNHHKSKTASEIRQRLFLSQGPPFIRGTLREENHQRCAEGLLPLKVICGG